MSFITRVDPDGNRPAAPQPRGLIHDLPQPAFAAACASLIRQVEAVYQPTLLVGIRTGGLVVAETIRQVRGDIPVLPLTCRRAATGWKERVTFLPRLLAAMPQPVVDRLRWLEHHFLSPRRRRSTAPQQTDRVEAEAIGHYLAQHPDTRRVLVVDDAVDSGVTLATVLTLLRQVCPPDTELRSAAITVTLSQPLVDPDFTVYRGVLCRFPWSFDAAG